MIFKNNTIIRQEKLSWLTVGEPAKPTVLITDKYTSVIC